MLHFTRDEFAARIAKTRAGMEARGLDAVLLFAPESQFWLTGYDTFGYCFFQCLVLSADKLALLTRSPDLRQAQLTSIVEDIRIWRDHAKADPTQDLVDMLGDLGLAGKRLGWETRTQGLTHNYAARLAERLPGLTCVSDMTGGLRLVKSPAELAYVRKAAKIGDLAWDAAVAQTRAGADEGVILGAMHQAQFAAGSDYPGNEFIIGSGDHALLCRYQSGRQVLQAQDQLTLEWAGTYRHYHAALMKTIVVGEPRPEHLKMQDAAKTALLACEDRLKPGRPMGDVFAAHAEVFDAAGLSAHRLNACGYSLSAKFSPSWMDDFMFFEDAPLIMEPGMVFFLHMILMDSDSKSAMCLGRTSIVTESGADPMSRMPLEMVVS